MNKKVALFVVSLLIILSFAVISGSAPDDKPKMALQSQDFLMYMERSKLGIVQTFTEDGYPLGDIPLPFDLSHVSVSSQRRIDSVPLSYFLGDFGRLTPVRNQGGCGSCWSFATYGSLESCLLPSDSNNFSEQHLIENHGFDIGECDGGNTAMSTAYLVRWDGPSDESDDPYVYLSGIEADMSSLQKKVQQVMYLPNRSDPLDNDTIKNFVVDYGAVYISMRWENGAYKSSTDAYYYAGSSSTNHGVCVVGWNDNYDKNNFDTLPPGNGAFIVRNSWGSGWGDNGYFYMSYYDSKLTPQASYNNAEASDVYEFIYQHDPLGWVTSYGYGDTTAYGANVFTAASDQDLEAVGFYTNDGNVDVTISVYTGVTGSTDPKNGTLRATKTRSFTYPGYYTVKLDSPVFLNDGEQFSVVIYFQTSGYSHPVVSESVSAGYSSGATASSGESFLSNSGSSWIDLGLSYGANVCIKAFTATAGEPEMHVKRGAMSFADGSQSDFGTIKLAKICAHALNFKIQNLGTATLNLTGNPAKVTLSGPDAGYFQVTQQPASSIPPGGITSFIIKSTYDTPPAVPDGWEKNLTIEINIPNDDADENPYNFTLKARAIK